ncbi:MAG TPA: chromosomal replication initiator protein DnaA [Myxococcota bacterium]|nr:chromosomal replication initiator protein DnaA [Myxococcota bacterium]HOA14132.1 chromosomal replication initiator protein DnaA [Myxococcota bacterium]HOC99678.1 chromosomal replication initiator protein DnaA [Myxococcota bacterium]HOH77303.1 chromosomal replication initiator protein DnaA [Myxococcota bacterium]HPV04870.1 chromosomal replication initiator protein DnaA [Myxococcota bacterium]
MQNLWDRARCLLKDRLDPDAFNKWIAIIRPCENEGGRLTLEVPDTYTAKHIQDNFAEKIKDALWDTTHRSVGVDFRVAQPDPSASLPVSAVPSDRKAGGQESPGIQNDIDRLKERFTFENFIVGDCNSFVHSAGLAVSRDPGGAYNPLFIYGGVGLGKTHVLHAIGHQIRRENPRLKIVCTSGETFTNIVMNAVNSKSMDSLRSKFRGLCDVLLVDDIQFVSSSQFVQTELFHTFNALYNDGKQVVITSDQPPSALDVLMDRLRSRFEWGLIADIQPPDEETRVRILLRKAQIEEYDLPFDVAEFLASRYSGSVRELEGALNRVSAHALLMKQAITLDMARRISIKTLNEGRGRVTSERVIRTVADYYNLSPVDIRGPKRHRAVSIPRYIAMGIIRDHLKFSLPQIGRIFDNRSHTTVLSGLKTLDKMVQTEASVNNAIRDICLTLGFM